MTALFEKWGQKAQLQVNAENAIARRKELENKLDEADIEKRNVQRKLDRAAVHVEYLEGLVDERKAICRSLEHRLTDAKAQRDALQGDLDIANTLVAKLETRLEAARERGGSLEHEITQIKGELASIRATAALLQQSLDSSLAVSLFLKKSVEEAKEDSKRRGEQLHLAKVHVHELQREIDETEELKQKLAETRAYANRLEQELASFKAAAARVDEEEEEEKEEEEEEKEEEKASVPHYCFSVEGAAPSYEPFTASVPIGVDSSRARTVRRHIPAPRSTVSNYHHRELLRLEKSDAGDAAALFCESSGTAQLYPDLSSTITDQQEARARVNS